MKNRALLASLLLSLFPVLGHAITYDVKVLFDTDNRRTTGCTVNTPSGSFPGVEQIVTTSVSVSGTVGTVTGVTRSSCIDPIGSVFSAPSTIDAGGWAVGVSPAGDLLVETHVTPSALSSTTIDVMRVGFVVTSGTLGDAVLSGHTANDLLFPAPDRVRRRAVNAASTVRKITLDGVGNDWSTLFPLSDGGPGSPALRIIDAYSFDAGSDFFFRVDLQSNPQAPTAVDDTYTTTSGGALNISAPGILANDTDPSGLGLTAILISGVQHGTLTLNADGSFNYLNDGSGAPLDSFRYKASDGVRLSNTAEVRIGIGTPPPPVGHAPVITSAASTTFTTGSAGTFTVTTTGTPTPAITKTGTLPTGVSFVDNGDGTATLSGTPSGGTGGNYSLTITATNAQGTVSQPFTLTVNQAPAFTSGSVTTFTVGAAGSFTVTAVGFPTPGLSESGALPSGVTFNLFTGTLSGTPAAGTGGIYTLLFAATNAAGTTSQTFTLTINETPSITSANAATFQTGVANSFLITTGGWPRPAITKTGALPSGLTLTDNGNGTATLSGSAGAGTGGIYPLTLTAANGIGSNATQNFTLTVNQPPAVTSATTTLFTVGTAGTFTVTATGFPAPSIAEAGALPAGVTYNASTHVLAGTPAAGTGGTYPITFTANNGVAPAAVQNFTLVINETSSFTSANAVTFQTGVAGTFTISTLGFPKPAISETGALPSGVTLLDNGNGTATLSGTPAAATGGTYVLTLTAINGVGANATQTFTLTVNQPPAVTSANGTTFTVGAAGTFTVTATGFPPPAIAESGALPTGVTYNAATHVLSGTPAAGTGGVYPITFTASNGVGVAAVQSFTLTINEASSFTSVNAVTFQTGVAGTFTISTLGFPKPAIAETGALPAGVTFTDNGNGTATLAGTPAAATGGIYPLSLSAINGVGANAAQSFTLTVNQAPAITSGNVMTFTAGQAGTFMVTTTGFPTNASMVISETGALPAGVTFVNNNNGTATLSGTPAAATGGVYAIVITANNGVAPNATQNFTLTVNQAPAITSANNATFTVGQAGTFTVTTTGFPAAAIARGGVALPSGVTFVDNGNGTGTLAGTPAASNGGTYAITFTATNAAGSTAPQSFTLTINQAPAITSGNAVAFTTGQAGTFTVTTTGFPTNASMAISETGGLPSGVTFVNNNNGTATLAGTPAAATGGVYAITITANNGVAPNATQSFTLTVNQAPAITSANNAIFTVGQAGTFTVTTTGFPAASIARGGVVLPSGVTFVDNGDGTGTLAGTPAASTGGTYAITFTATNAAGSTVPQAFTLTINQAPAITSGNAVTFTTGAAGTFTVTTTGFPTNASMAISETGALPTGVTLVNNNNGTATLAGTPAAATGGVYAITITANNGVAPNATQSFTLTVNQAPAITSANNATFTVGAAGTFTVTTTGFPVSSIARGGVVLPSGVTFVDNGDGTGTLAGTPAAATGGTYAITFTATNAVGSTAPQSFTLTINQAPAFTSANSATFKVGTSSPFNVTTSGFPVAAVLTYTGTLPAGVIFTDNGNGTATLSGAPSLGSDGVYPLVFTANNGVAPNATQNFTLTVNAQPAITSASSGVFPPGVPTTFTVTTTGFPTGASMVITYTGTLPTGLTFVDNHDGTATLSGSATGAGTYPITINADNGVAPSANQSFSILLDFAPTITSANNATFKVGVAGTFTVTTSAQPTAALSKTGALPTGVTFTDNGNGTATIAGTPAAATGGTYPIVITANNAINPNGTQNFTLTVQQPPAITSANNVTFKVGTAGTFTVTTTGFPTGASMLLSESGALPGGVTFTDNNNGTATLAGTPDPATGGTYSLTITANNGVTPNATQSFTLTVQQAPAITSATSTTFVAGQAGTFNVTTTGFPTAVVLSKTGTLPTGVNFTDNGNGTATLSGTPGAGTGGSYPIVITGNNGVTPNATQNFTLTVNQPPAITSANNVTFKVGVAGTFSVTTTGFPIPALTQGGVTLPSGITFTDNGNGTGTLAGTAAAATGGTYAISFTAANGVLPDATLPFTLTVQQAPAITSGTSTTFVVGVVGTFSVTTTGFPTAVALSESGSLPSGVTFVDNGNGTATLAGTPAAATGGSYPLTITGNNGVTPNATQSFTLLVNQPPAITSANNVTFAPGVAATPFTVTTTGFPINGITRSGTLPSGVTFTDNGNNTATIAGTPAAGTQSGSPYAWVITAANTVSPDATQNFALNITCPTITVSGSIPTLTFNTAMTPVTFTQSGGNGTITWSANAALATAGLSINSSTGAVSGTPSATGTFSVTITATDVGGCTGTKNVTLTVAPKVTGEAYGTVNALVDNTQFVLTGGATATPGTPSVQVAGTVLANDTPAGAVTVTAGIFATTQGGSVTIASDGTFLYTPAVHAAAITSDSFTYTVSSDSGATGTPATATGTVNLTLANRVWYVKNNGSGTTGQSDSPFTTLAAAQTASAANDIIFVYNGSGTNSGQNAGISLKNGQQLLGEINGLVVNAQTLVAVGSRPVIGNGSGDGVTVAATAGNLTGVFIKGLSIGGSANGINLNSSGANTLTATVDNVFITSTGTNHGIRISGGSSATSTVTVQNTTVTSATQNGIDAQQTVAGNLVLNFNSNTVTASGTGINVNGAGSTSTTITNFANNNISGNTGGNGISVTSATFDAIPGTAAFDTVSGGITVIGSSGNGVGTNGMVLTTVKGDLSFTDLDIVSSNGAALFASSAAAFNAGTGIGFQISVGAGVGTLDATNGPAADLNTVTANLPWSTIKSANSTSTGVSLVSVLGTFTTSGATSSITSATGTDFNINGGTATVTYDGTITDTTGRVVSVASATGGTKTFSGAITNNGGTGISLTSNTGATINFTGAIALSTTTNDAFIATGAGPAATSGGTVTATNVNNTLTTTTGTALNVTNTTIGTGGLVFKSISANGGPNGIVLNNTGTTAGLTVNGDGTNTSVGGNSTGGTISNMAGANGVIAGSGIYLKSTKNVVLRRMTINGTNQNFGIRGFSVDGFTLEYSTVNGTNGTGNNAAPDDSGEGSIYFGNLTTTGITTSGTFTNNNIAGGAWDNMHIENTSGTTTITVKGNTFGLNGTTNGNSSLLMMARNNGTVMNAVVGGPGAGEPNTFTGAPGSLVNFTGQQGTTMDVQVKNNVMSDNHPGNIIGGGGLTVASAGTMTFNVDSNSMRDANGSAITIQKADPLPNNSTSTNLSGRVTNNTIGVAGVVDSASKTGNGIFLSAAGLGTVSLTVTGNSIRNWHGNGALYFDNTGGSYTQNNTITGNTIAEPGAGSFCSIAITNGANTSSDTINVCATIGGAGALKNTITGPSGLADIYLGSSGQNGGHTFNLPGYAGGANLANVNAFVTGNNTISGGAAVIAYVDSPATAAAFTGVGTGCPTP